MPVTSSSTVHVKNFKSPADNAGRKNPVKTAGDSRARYQTTRSTLILFGALSPTKNQIVVLQSLPGFKKLLVDFGLRFGSTPGAAPQDRPSSRV